MSQNPLPPSRSYDLALRNFRLQAGLTPQELDELETTTLEDLQKALATMQTKQQHTKKLMYLKRLQPFLDAMEQYSTVINIFVNTSNLLAFVWGPVKFLLVTTSNVSEVFNALLDGYRSIGEQMPLLLQYRDFFDSNQYMQKALASIFEDVLEFHLQAVQLFKQRSWKQLFHATKQSLIRKVNDVADSLKRHRAFMQSQASLIQYQEFDETRTYMKEKFAKLQHQERDIRYRRVQEWLACPIDSRARHDHAIRQRFGNSGQWLLDDQQFKNWFAPNQCTDPLLWLHGIPGAGKTILASIVVEEASKVPGAVILCFYCKQSDEKTSAFLAIAKALLSQLLPSNGSILDYLYEKAANSGEAILSTTKAAKECLENALNSCTKVYIVLDGLDEYSRDDRKELTSWFRRLITSLPTANFGSIRCLFVSQEDGYARKDLSMLSQIKMTSAANRADIEGFCRNWHQKIEAKFGPLTEPEHHVTNVVSQRRMFLFAKLVTWNLHEQTNRADFEAEMQPDRVPTELDQAYDRIIDRLIGPTAPPSRRTSILKLLGWLASARRPLKWFEVQCAVSVDLENGVLSVKHQFQEDCKDLCASLVEIDSTQTVTLVHSTTRGYLIRKHIRESEVELSIATICVVYLSMPEFECDRPEEDVGKAIFRGVYSFADYAVCFWAFHLESAISKFSNQDVCQLGDILESFELFLDNHWLEGTAAETVSMTLRNHLHALESHEFFDSICQAVAWAKSQLRSAVKKPSDDARLRLLSIMSQIRRVLESISESSSVMEDERELIIQHYGANHFKCDRMNCQSFNKGFNQREQRDQHVAKHERSFTCGSSGCPYEFIGFVTKKDLQKHTFDLHGIKADDDQVEFPDAERGGGIRRPSSFQCNLCPLIFTRANNLRSHLRLHSGERPFVCTVCGKAFARLNDRKRHEGLHSGERKFFCGGEHPSRPGVFWGCGHKFARADTLGYHFQSEGGRICIKPLREEEKALRQARHSQDEHALLLQRYPMLRFDRLA
ncbi:hypothetical protein LTR47_009475 [Exophiala xenobiotica]|nr:hypothetical protein LTR72_010999 [Exophiala xenobiotica]KAK5225222.1 hypothetical protein LTR47_009475 [Exophiala xenobiotica]KAK5288058.1 hypothetical protein LTR14_008395 [Exophiala xenobiotica]KAK5346854.1 hypothetical protein LTR61_009295 [Exophiala xenobiotica]KAK5360702.1 hypothetical protein LTR11_010038 [Exophiala xenobiotica]